MFGHIRTNAKVFTRNEGFGKSDGWSGGFYIRVLCMYRKVNDKVRDDTEKFIKMGKKGRTKFAPKGDQKLYGTGKNESGQSGCKMYTTLIII